MGNHNKPDIKDFQESTEIQLIVDQLRQLTPEQRMDVFSEFCHSCGDSDPRCQCWNDE